MKAEYQEFNGDWFKDCTKCNKPYGAHSLEGLAEFFRRDSKTEDGFSRHCKLCRIPTDRERQLSRTRKRKWLSKPGSQAIHDAREKAQQAYINPKLKKSIYKCSVLNCESWQEIELHHVDYADPLAVVPLCKRHHMDNHRTCGLAGIKPGPQLIKRPAAEATSLLSSVFCVTSRTSTCMPILYG